MGINYPCSASKEYYSCSTCRCTMRCTCSPVVVPQGLVSTRVSGGLRTRYVSRSGADDRRVFERGKGPEWYTCTRDKAQGERAAPLPPSSCLLQALYSCRSHILHILPKGKPQNSKSRVYNSFECGKVQRRKGAAPSSSDLGGSRWSTAGK